MNPDQVKCVVQIIVEIMRRIARKTSTPLDDAMVGILELNRDRIAEVAHRLVPAQGCQMPTGEQITAALRDVGIKV
jgi:hypothetical protein